MLILAVSNGHNLTLARQVAQTAASQGHHAELLDLVSLELPLFTAASEPFGPGSSLELITRELRLHQRLWICSPEYNGGIPPALTNALAWLSRTTDDFRSLFNGIPVALSTHSGGGGTKVLTAMRLQLAYLGCTVLGRELLSTHQKAANPDTIASMLAELHRLPTTA